MRTDWLIAFCFMVFLFPTKMNSQTKHIKKIGILVAMEKEYELLKDIANQDNVVVIQCGIGKVNAAMACVELIRDEQPDIVLSLGCAGGNGEGAHLGDVVISTCTAYHDVYCGEGVLYGQVQGMPDCYETPKWIVEKVCKINNRVVPGLIVSGDWLVDSKQKMSYILACFPEARAVDMESAAIAQVCYKYKIPFVSLRIISDLPMSNEHASQYTDFWKTVSERTFGIATDFVKKIAAEE